MPISPKDPKDVDIGFDVATVARNGKCNVASGVVLSSRALSPPLV